MFQYLISLLLDAALTVDVQYTCCCSLNLLEVTDKMHLTLEIELDLAPVLIILHYLTSVCFYTACMCAERTKILMRLGDCLLLFISVLSERSWQHLWTY